MGSLIQWNRFRQNSINFQQDEELSNLCEPDESRISQVTLPMSKVPNKILTQLKPHRSDYVRVNLDGARYWHVGKSQYENQQLFSYANNQVERISKLSQNDTKQIYAFVKKSVFLTQIQGQEISPGCSASNIGSSSSLEDNQNKTVKNRTTHSTLKEQISNTISPAVIIGQPTDSSVITLEQGGLTKRRFATHTLGPRETVDSIVLFYTGTQDLSLLYDFNYPTFTPKKPPQVGDNVKVCTGFDVFLKGQFYNSRSVLITWYGPVSGSQQATLESVAGDYKADKGYDWELILPLVAGDYRLTAESEGARHMVNFSVSESDTQQQIIDFVYLPEEHCFIAVTQSLADILDSEMAALNSPIEQLKQSLTRGKNNPEESKQITEAKQALNKTLKPLVKGPSANNITEVIGYKGRKYTYVRSDKIADHRRSYRLDTDIRDGRRFSDNNGRLNNSKLKQALKNDLSKLKTSFKFDEKIIDTYTTVWGEWAKEFNKDLNIKGFEKSDYFDASAEAQLMRYTHGASLAATFSPKDGVFALQGDFKIDFAVAEAKAVMSGYFPNKVGYELIFSMPLKNSTQEKTFNLGAIRLAATVSAFGYAGAKLQGSANMGCTVKQGQLMLDGLNEAEQQTMQQKDKRFQPVKAEVNAFVGVSAGCEATGAIQWDNPEKVGNTSFCDLAKLGSKLSGSIGAGAQAGFYLGYDTGKFVLRAKAGLVWGVGVGGELVCEVGVDEIVTLAQFVYHQLKNNDYDYLEFIQPLAFEVLYKAVAMHIATGEEVVNFIGGTTVQIDKWWRTEVFVHQQAKHIISRIQHQPEMLKFTVPEAKGAFLHLLANPNLASLIDFDTYTWSGLNEQRESAIITILKHILCTEELDEVLQHMGEGGAKCSRENGLSQLNRILEGSQQREFDAWQRKLPSRARSGSVAMAMIDAEPFMALA